MGLVLTGGQTISYPCDGRERCYVFDFVSKNEMQRGCEQRCADNGKGGGSLKCYCTSCIPVQCGRFSPGGATYNHVCYETCICKCKGDCWLFDD